MVDIPAIVNNYLAAALRDQGHLLPYDTVVIAALGAPADRNSTDAVVRWLKLYRVLRIKKRTHRPIARAILSYACIAGNCPANLQGNALLTAYDDLYLRIQKAAPKRKSGIKRDVMSLTSKALWCTSPDTVPIYDSRALNAVLTLTKLSGFNVAQQIDYTSYIAMWYRLYSIAAPTINAANLNGYPYHVRVFDKILWLIG